MKNKFHAYIIIAIFFKLSFVSQLASAQKSRIWSTYYGGVISTWGKDVAVDSLGNVYLAGYTSDTNNISSPVSFQNTFGGGGYDAYLAKFDANGHRLWATYCGGNGFDRGISVTTDIAGNVYLAGTTSSTGIAFGGFQDTIGGGSNAFLIKFDTNGNRLWATYYGGPLGTTGASVVTDATGNVYLAGNTSDTTGIASGGFRDTLLYNSYGTYLVKFDSNGNRIWATYYGGTMGSFAYPTGQGIATDPLGNVYLTGLTSDTIGIASGGFQDTLGQGFDAFLVKFDPNGNRIWATYYGGSYSTYGYGVSTDLSGNVYLAGSTHDTTSSDIAFGGFQNTSLQQDNINGDAFLVKFNANGNRIWATYYGGIGDDEGFSVGTDASGNVWLAGTTNSDSSIASGGYKNNSSHDGESDGEQTFLVMFDPYGNRQCATYYSDNTKQGQAALALDNLGNVYLVGGTQTDTSLGLGGFQDTLGGGFINTFLAKFTTCSILPIASIQSSDSTFCSGNCINFSDLSTNSPTSWHWSFSGGNPSSSTSRNPQSICYPNSGVYPVTLIASNSSGSDTLILSNFITVISSPPTPTITQSNDTLFCSTDPSYTSYQWYDSSAIISGATNSFLVITHSGNYNVAVHNENGCQISVGINIIQGIQNYTINNLFSLSPNPASQLLTIHALSSHINGQISVSILNVLGQEIIPPTSLQWREQNAVIDISKLPAALYFLQMKTENAIATERFVKE